MPLAPNGPIVLHGAPLTAPPPTGPHKPNLAIQARLAPELIAAIIEARKKGLQLEFEPYGPNAGFHIDGQHFPLVNVTAERTPHEIYAFSQLPQSSLQVVGKVVGRCTLQRNLTEEDQEKLRQSRSNAETNRDRTIGRIDVPDAPAKPTEKKKPPIRKAGVITASTVNSLRQSPAPGTAGNSPPPGAPPRPNTLDGPPNPFQVLLIHHLAYAPTTLKQLAATLKRQAKEIRPCLDSVLSSTCRPTLSFWRALAHPHPDDIKRITADANRAFDELKLPSDAPVRLALQPAPPPASQPASQPTPPATSAKPTEVGTPKHHPLPARPAATAATTATANNGRLDVPKPPRGLSPTAVPDASSREMSVDRAPVRPPVRVTTKERSRPADDSEPVKDATQSKKTSTAGAKSKMGTNGKTKTKVKSNPIITADSDGEDFVPTKPRERKAPPPPAPTPAPAPAASISAPSPVPAPIRAPAVSLQSRATPSSSNKHPVESTGGTKRPKREVDTTLDDLERELDSGYAETSKPVALATATTTQRDRERERDRDRSSLAGVVKKKVTDKGDKPKVKKEAKSLIGTGTGVGTVVRTITRDPGEKRKRREVDQDSDASFDLNSRRSDESILQPSPLQNAKSRPEIGSGNPNPARLKQGLKSHYLLDSQTEQHASRTKCTNRPNHPRRLRPMGQPCLQQRELAAAAQSKVNGSSKKDRASVMYTSSEDEGTPAPRRSAPSHPPARAAKPAAARVPSDVSTPRERERERERTEIIGTDENLPRLRAGKVLGSIPRLCEYECATADERFKVQKLLKDMADGDHDSVDTSLVESLTKAYREAHEELVALRERLAASA
ncbi:hypothetical protein RhiXN_06454 [Rhizoctonia solani]|uniref:Uncharacterized protein n=1 Tax=Rhizoctonia solani TaxID=456999 RepID=A0A8H8NZD2_9AGAM|nr:uncharacterized protein RhiXN_06454 [Rhizoctonia solani]QRW21465.1 hypothetical protein RhiXN_06454 [Rhizoctonia solani]